MWFVHLAVKPWGEPIGDCVRCGQMVRPVLAEGPNDAMFLTISPYHWAEEETSHLGWPVHLRCASDDEWAAYGKWLKAHPEL